MRVSLAGYQMVSQAPYPNLTVTILAECVDTLFEDINMEQI